MDYGIMISFYKYYENRAPVHLDGVQPSPDPVPFQKLLYHQFQVAGSVTRDKISEAIHSSADA